MTTGENEMLDILLNKKKKEKRRGENSVPHTLLEVGEATSHPANFVSTSAAKASGGRCSFL